METLDEMLTKFNSLPSHHALLPNENMKSLKEPKIPEFTRDASQSVLVRVDRSLRVAIADLPEIVLYEVKAQLTWRNPIHQAMLRQGKHNPKITPLLTGFFEDDGYLYLARGFASQLMRTLQAHRLQGKYEDATIWPEKVDLTFHGQLYGYQKTALQEIGVKRFGVVVGFIESGKKVIALHLAAKVGLPALVVVKTKVQAYLWVEAATRFLGLSDKDIGVIGNGRADLDRIFTVGIERSLVRNMDVMADRVGFLIVDQCDYTHLNIFFKIVRKISSPYMLGLAVTGRRKDGLNALMAAYIGPVLHRIPMDRVRREASMVRPEFVGRKTAFDYRYQDDWGPMVKALALDQDRNDLLVTDILMATADRKAKAVVLCNLLVQMELLVKMLGKRHRKADTLSGKTTAAQLETLRESFDRGKVQVVCVTGQSLPLLKPRRITHLFIASPLRSQEVLAQAVGLLLRMDPGERVQVFDYQDMEMHLEGSYRGRCRVYRDMGVEGV